MAAGPPAQFVSGYRYAVSQQAVCAGLPGAFLQSRPQAEWGRGVQAADVVTVAVASNFKSTATDLANRFLEETGNPIRLSSGSTGKLYTQIANGAPFDVFLAADAERPALLEDGGFAVRGSRFTYATGSLVLFSTRVTDCAAALHDENAGFVAIANPVTSPYGKAARQYLDGEGLWASVSTRAVYGENVTQAWQFAFTGNAVVGFAARAQMHLVARKPTCSYDVPTTSHEPLEHRYSVRVRVRSGAIWSHSSV